MINNHIQGLILFLVMQHLLFANDPLQNKADDIAKTAAARYADEAIQVRKERM